MAQDLILNPRRTALVVVDMQNAFLSDRGSMPKLGLSVARARAIIPAVGRLIDEFRRAKAPVVFTQMTFKPDFSDAGLLLEALPKLRSTGHVVKNTWDWEMTSELLPAEGELVVEKTRFNAFHATGLERLLRDNLKVDTLVVSGVATNVCVESTIRDAVAYDFHVLIPRDATASFTLEMEEAALLTLGKFFAQITSVEAVIAALRAHT